MCLIEHRPEIIESSCVPTKVAVIPDGIGDPDDDIARCGAGSVATFLRRDADLAAVGVRRESTRILSLGKRVERLQQVGENARALGRRCGKVGLIADRPDRDGGMVIVLTDQLGELLLGVGGEQGTRGRSVKGHFVDQRKSRPIPLSLTRPPTHMSIGRADSGLAERHCRPGLAGGRNPPPDPPVKSPIPSLGDPDAWMLPSGIDAPH